MPLYLASMSAPAFRSALTVSVSPIAGTVEGCPFGVGVADEPRAEGGQHAHDHDRGFDHGFSFL